MIFAWWILLVRVVTTTTQTRVCIMSGVRVCVVLHQVMYSMLLWGSGRRVIYTVREGQRDSSKGKRRGTYVILYCYSSYFVYLLTGLLATLLDIFFHSNNIDYNFLWFDFVFKIFVIFLYYMFLL